MSFDDKTILINCGECLIREVGIVAMLTHIVDAHPTYSLAEASTFSRIWADDAFERVGKEEADYDISRHQEDKDD